MTARESNLEKKRRRCLKCNRRITSDRCHRLCARCRDDNAGTFERTPLHIIDADGLGDVPARRNEQEEVLDLIAITEAFESDY